MRTSRKLAIISITIWTLIFFTNSAHADVPHSSYTLLKPAFTLTEEGGTYTGQVNFGSVPITFQWSFTLNPVYAAGAIGPVTENTTISCEGKLIASSHHIEPADYKFHGSNQLDINCPQYKLDGRLDFMYQGAMGHATYFDYFVVSLA